MKKYGSLFIFSIILFISGILIWSFYFDVQMTVFGMTIKEKGLTDEAFYFDQLLLYFLSYSVLCIVLALCFYYLKNKKLSYFFIEVFLMGIGLTVVNVIASFVLLIL
jgi:hypothetical protein